MKIIIQAQRKEWYGDENHIGEEGHGRYKMKGGGDFIVDVPHKTFLYNENIIRSAFDKKFDKNGLFFRYEFIEAEPYYEPDVIELNLG